MTPPPPPSTPFPYPTPFRSSVDYPNQVNDDGKGNDRISVCEDTNGDGRANGCKVFADGLNIPTAIVAVRSEEHTSELQSRPHLVCRLLLEKKKKIHTYTYHI